MAKRNRRLRLPPATRRVIETRNPAPADLDVSSSWFLVYTAPRGEERAIAGLHEAGCTTFWPSVHRVTIHGKRRNERNVGVFPRYLFASGPLFPAPLKEGEQPKPRCTIRVGGRPISYATEIDGICDVIRGPMGISRVPAAAIAMIAAYQNEAAAEAPAVEANPFHPGEVLTITDGPFASYLAVVDRVLSPTIAEVLISIFGRSTRAEMDVAHLRAA